MAITQPTPSTLRGCAAAVATDFANNNADYLPRVANALITLASEASTDTVAAATAAGTSIADAGSFTAQTTVEGATQEIYQDLKSVQTQVNVDVTSAILAAGTPMAAWADNVSSNPGVTLVDSKSVAIRWNNNATQTAIWYRVPMPQNMDDTAAIVLHALVSATGTTDSPTLTVTAFFQTTAALHDADVDCGGTSSAYTGGTAKQVQELTLSIAAGDVPPAPCALAFTVKPTDGTLGTDDCLVHALWFEIKKKLLTS